MSRRILFLRLLSKFCSKETGQNLFYENGQKTILENKEFKDLPAQYQHHKGTEKWDKLPRKGKNLLVPRHFQCYFRKTGQPNHYADPHPPNFILFYRLVPPWQEKTLKKVRFIGAWEHYYICFALFSIISSQKGNWMLYLKACQANSNETLILSLLSTSNY